MGKQHAAVFVFALFAPGCEASTPEPPRPPRALMVPSWVEKAGTSNPETFVPSREGSVELQGDPGAQFGSPQPRHDAAPAARASKTPSTAAGSTFFPPEYNSRMFGGCAANDYTGGKCPDGNH
jgi:hypothetical protein